MKKIATLFIALCAASAWAQTYVQPHTNRNGTYVEGYYRSEANNTDRDNYSTKGNTNPFTGQEGTRTPQADRPNYQTPQTTYGQQCGVNSRGQYICK